MGSRSLYCASAFSLIAAFGSATAADEPWRFATLLPVTGAAAAYAVEMRMGFEIARDEINAKGGIGGKPIQLTILDTQSNNGQVVSLMRAACSEQFAVLGPSMSAEARVAFPIANGMNCPALSGSAVIDGLTSANRPWTFTYSVPAAVLTPAAVNVIVDRLKPKTATVVIDKGEVSGNEQGERSVKVLGERGVAAQVVTVTANDVDFGPMVTRLIGQRPELVIIATSDKAALGVIKEMRKTGQKIPILITQAAFTPLVANAGVEALEGVYRYTEFDPTSSNDPRVQAFVVEFKKRNNGRLPTQLSTQTYDMTYMVKHVLESAKISGHGSDDRKKFIDAIAALKDWQSFSGPLTMTPSGYPNKAIAVLQFRNGVPQRIN
jgi:branched-chain amino acid transport system substrate-binding protein